MNVSVPLVALAAVVAYIAYRYMEAYAKPRQSGLCSADFWTFKKIGDTRD